MSAPSLWSGLELITHLDARVSGLVPPGVGGVSIDTRTLVPGDLFFAIRGDSSDGHDYVAAAFEKGAAAAVVDEAHADALKGAGPLYVVRQVLPALEALGIASRARSHARIIAVTGSVGKTSTKEALRLMLEAHGATHASAASYNNHWGVPLTLARMPADTRYGIFEIGMNHAGEITPLTAMVRPHIAIVTTVAPVHLEFFDGIDGIADAKAEIFSGVLPGGVAIINRDISTFERLRAHAAASPARHVLSFGEHHEADARLVAVTPFIDGSLMKADILGQDIDVHLGAPGKHLAINALAVLLAARACGVDPSTAGEALSRFTAGAGRGARSQHPVGQGTFTLIDESYNANPASMQAALALLGASAPGPEGRRIAVLGEMRELGPQGSQLHASLDEDIGRNAVDLVFAAGPLMRALFDAVPPDRRGRWAENADEVEPALFDAIGPGDVVMVKGSNASRMGPLVAHLKTRFAPASQEA